MSIIGKYFAWKHLRENEVKDALEGNTTVQNNPREPHGNRNEINKKCKFWNLGFCRERKECPFLHPETECSYIKFQDKTCKKRHRRICKKLSKTGYCKWGDNCQFSHKESSDVEQEEVEDIEAEYPKGCGTDTSMWEEQNPPMETPCICV